MAVKPIPEGYEGITPYLVVAGAAKALDFYKEVLGATELFRMPYPDGRIGHAELKIGQGILMVADEHPEMGFRGPKSYGGTPVGLLVYVTDADTVYRKAPAAGAKEFRPVQDQFYGDRSGTFTDPFGHQWTVATRKEDLSPEELKAPCGGGEEKIGAGRRVAPRRPIPQCKCDSKLGVIASCVVQCETFHEVRKRRRYEGV